MTLIETESQAYLDAHKRLPPILNHGEFEVDINNRPITVRWIEVRPYPLIELVYDESGSVYFQALPKNVMSYYYFMGIRPNTVRGVLIDIREKSGGFSLTFGMAQVPKHEIVIGALKEALDMESQLLDAAQARLLVTFNSTTIALGAMSHHTYNYHQIDMFLEKDQSNIPNDSLQFLRDLANASFICLNPVARKIANQNWDHDARSSYSLHLGRTKIDYFFD